MDHFNIQVDNPLTVLTQDQARGFLSNSTPKDKYVVRSILTLTRSEDIHSPIDPRSSSFEARNSPNSPRSTR